jgi:class I fructose-bisphosphate aldolase
MSATITKLQELLGTEAESLLNHECQTINKSMLTLPGVDFVDRSFAMTNRSPQVLKSLQALYGHGRLGGTGYVSILPVDQGIEHSAGASFAPNPIYFDPEKIIELAVEADCNGVATTFGVLAANSRKYAHKIPFIVKLNHNEFLSYPNTFNQIEFGSVDEAWNLGATAVGATIYFRITGIRETDR